MKTLLSLFAITALAVTGLAAPGNSISFTNNATAQGDGVPVNLALGKFDTGLGTLNSVVVTINFGSLGGSFDVTASPVNAANVTSASGIPSVQAAPTNSLGFTSSAPGLVGVTTSPSLAFSVPAGTLQTFSVNSTNWVANSAQNINSSFWGAYQSAGGVGSVIFQVANTPFIFISGGGYTLNATAFTATADMTVTYNYSPTAAVPEPGTWAVGALLLGGAAYTVWRRRQNATAETIAAA